MNQTHEAWDKIRKPLRQRRIIPRIASRNTVHGNGLRKHWSMIESVFAWQFQQRRLRVRYEKRADIHQRFPDNLIYHNLLDPLSQVMLELLMENGRMPDKERKEVGPTELTVGPRPATMDQIVDAILGNEDELISNISEFPDSIVVGKSTPMSHPPTDLEVKTLCLLARVAISRGDRDTILTSCRQATYRDNEAGALITMLAPRAGAVDIEHTGLYRLKASHPELLEWTIEEAIKLGPLNSLAYRAFSWLTSVNSERAKELAPTILSDPDCSLALASICKRAMSVDPPLRFEVSTPTLTPAQQANVKRIFLIACRAIFSVDMDEATEGIRQLGAEPVQLAAPLLVAAARMEGDRPQAAAREELRKIAPSVAAVLPAQFGFLLPRRDEGQIIKI